MKKQSFMPSNVLKIDEMMDLFTLSDDLKKAFAGKNKEAQTAKKAMRYL